MHTRDGDFTQINLREFEKGLFAISADASGDNRLDLGEFCGLMRRQPGGENLSDKVLRARFESMDVDGSGYISVREFDIEKAVQSASFDMADTDGDFKLDFVECA